MTELKKKISIKLNLKRTRREFQYFQVYNDQIVYMKCLTAVTQDPSYHYYYDKSPFQGQFRQTCVYVCITMFIYTNRSFYMCAPLYITESGMNMGSKLSQKLLVLVNFV